MRIVKRTPRAILLSVAALMALGPVTLFAAVISRDLDKQLDLIQAHSDGRAIYGKIVSSEVLQVPAIPDIFFTRLTVEVKKDLVSGKTTPETLTLYVPGAGEHRLSISPPESETRVGEFILFFLRKDATITAFDGDAFKVDSFAESFRTQTNRRGNVIVLGEGKGSAIPENTSLDRLAKDVSNAVTVLKAGK